MKFWNIALFFIILNTFGGTLVTSLADAGVNFPENVYFDALTQEQVQELESQVDFGVSDELTEQDPLTEALGWFYQIVRNSVMAFFNPLKKYVLFPAFMINLVIPDLNPAFGVGLSTIILLIQIAGVLQLVTGRSFKEVE